MHQTAMHETMTPTQHSKAQRHSKYRVGDCFRVRLAVTRKQLMMSHLQGDMLLKWGMYILLPSLETPDAKSWPSKARDTLWTLRSKRYH